MIGYAQQSMYRPVKSPMAPSLQPSHAARLLFYILWLILLPTTGLDMERAVSAVWDIWI